MIWSALKNALFPRQAEARGEADVALKSDDTATPSQVASKQIAVARTGMTLGRDADMAFIASAIGGNAFAKGIDLRRHGTPLPADKVRQLGLRSSTILTAEYMSILTPQGVAEPVDAAQFIVSAYLSEGSGARQLALRREAGIVRVHVIPNNMAAGPCPACIELAKHPIPVEQAPTGPLPQCPHPTQCKLWTRSVLDWD